ncbi:hypothetical protein Dalk_2759 [Desulfatibacillum aliphaticivorans]|uniref:Uncharacterized protein n=1 Tax=Desulfatibacillum aliphaticivorans TaxID=218208 RepID=B8FKS9_DESAL|nr:hypothetical protein Dalk_2759 [Desulfatibacillum aliphaticivorans]
MCGGDLAFIRLRGPRAPGQARGPAAINQLPPFRLMIHCIPCGLPVFGVAQAALFAAWVRRTKGATPEIFGVENVRRAESIFEFWFLLSMGGTSNLTTFPNSITYHGSNTCAHAPWQDTALPGLPIFWGDVVLHMRSLLPGQPPSKSFQPHIRCIFKLSVL